ncbi:MAG: MaoC family dehydratase N-terminal domain-containing protein, partial [Deltaproteobacteria bacterium]|nr:MaoC family dehydratase N-terminal domain-containing protein [Deltaproteobacteria bacterium]
MRWEDVQKRFPDFDTSDVDRWIGVPLGGAHMRDDVHVNDIRRWAQGMQNPNPLYYDAQYAAESRFGEIVAQQSFSVCTDDSHGAAPAIQGTIPNTHMIFGGDEWWFYGQRIHTGDRIRQDRMLFDYKVAETKFAGPTMFSRGDTTYISQVGLVVAKQRSTSVRYRADDARDKALCMQDELPTWSDAELADLEKQKFEYIQSIRDLGHDRRLFV